MNKEKKKKDILSFKYFLTVILFFVSVIISHMHWFIPKSILQFGDWGYRYSEYAKDLFIEWGSWSSAFQFGAVNIVLFGYPVRGLAWSSLVRLGLEYEDALKLGIFIPVAILAFISPFIFVWYKTKNLYIASILAFFYSSIPYLLVTQATHAPISFVFAATPLLFVFFEKAFVEKSFKWWIIFVMFFALCSAYDLRIAFIVSFLLVFYYLILIKKYKLDLIRLRQVLMAMLILILLQAYWLLTILKTGAKEYSDITSSGLFGNDLFDLLHSLTITKWNWTGYGIDWTFSLMPVPIYLFIIPCFVFIGIIFLHKSKEDFYSVVYFGILCVIGILLTKQSAEPFASLYLFLYEKFPGFSLFREASKFFLITSIGYLGILTLFLNKLLKLKKTIPLMIICGVLIIVSFINFTPLIMQSVGAVFVPREIPSDYRYLTERINYQDDDTFYRTLSVPRSSNWILNGYLRPRVDLVNILGKDKELQKYFDKNLPIAPNIYNSRIYNFLNKSYLQDILSMASIRYVIVPIQDIANDDDFFYKNFGGDEDPSIRQWYINQLNKINWLKKIDIGTKDLVVYENERYKEPIFSFSNLINFSSFKNLDSKYNFITNKLTKDFYFLIDNEKTLLGLLNNIDGLFEDTQYKDLNIENKSIHTTLQASSNKKVRLYANVNDKSFPQNISLNGNLISSGFVDLKKGENIFEYKNPKFSLENLIENPSFEDGFWQEKVGDCHNRDQNPVLAMSLNGEEKTDGEQSLQLEAKRHIACTFKEIPVKSGSVYFLSFDYQSPNAKKASYRLAFNDEEKTTIWENDEERTIIWENIDIEDKEWHTFSKIIKVPDGSTLVSLRSHAVPINEKTNTINRYDNFKLIEIPDFKDKFYLVSEPEEKLREPALINFDLINPTKKIVHIKGVTTPFYLAMSESYHSQWQAQMNTRKINGFLNNWWPFVKPKKVADKYHYKLNDFINAWYINPAELCKNSNTACTKNTDGSFDMEMTIEFFPQRWFYLGLLISGTTLFGCVGYLTFNFIRRKKLNKK